MNARMRREIVLCGGRDRIADQIIIADLRVEQLIDERIVGAVFEQAAHQIWQQFFMPPDRCVGADFDSVLIGQTLMQAVAHAVQALKFQVSSISGHLQNSGGRVGVVRGKLGVDMIAMSQQLARTGNVADVRVFLAGEDRITVQPQLLRPFDFAIPISAFDQAHRDFSSVGLGEILNMVDHG